MSLAGRRAAAALHQARTLGRTLASEASHRSFPRVSGTTRVRGTYAPIEVIRDRHGVPHVLAATPTDAMFGHGYVHAQDRLFQMEGARRLASGRLAEVGGTQLLPSDRFLRRVGLHRAAERDAATLPAETAEWLDAYSAGVNAGVADLPTLPPEFELLECDFEPWRIADSLLVGRLLSFGFAGNWNTELIRERLAAALGPEVAAALDPVHPRTGTATGEPHGGTAERMLAAYAAAVRAGLPSGLASNGWAVTGDRTRSGAPLLAGDPHVDVALPGLFHVAHVRGGTLDVIGASVAGVPGAVIGHHETLGWTLTAGMADVADCYIETFDEADPRRYRTPDGWAEAEEHIERIEVRGEAPVEERVLETRHGPVIGPALPGEGRAIALHSTALGTGDLATPLIALWQARDVAEADRALDAWPGATFNVILADTTGRIGYRLAGEAPRRAPGQGLLPQDGATSDGPPPAWPPEALPRLADPPDGVVVSANNAPGGDLELGEEWCEPRRAERIRELIEARPRHDVVSFAAIQVDRYSANLHLFGRLLLERSALSPEHATLVERWDGMLVPGSAAAALVVETFRELSGFLAERIAGDLGDELLGHGAEGTLVSSAFAYRTQGPLVAATDTASPPWFDGAEDRDRQLRGAAIRAVATLEARYGTALGGWSLGAQHRIAFRHALHGVPGVGLRCSRGVHPYGGDVNTVSQALAPGWREEARVVVAPGYRQVLDLSDWDASVFMLPTGTSGIPGHPRYDDCIAEYLAGTPRPLLFSRPAIEAAAEATLTIRPQDAVRPGA